MNKAAINWGARISNWHWYRY